MIRKIIIIVIAIVLGLTAWELTHKPKHVVHAPIHKPAIAQVTHGIQKPYNDCTPNQPETDQTVLQQQELQNTENQMAKYNDVPNNTNNPDYQRLYTLYKEEIANYDSCTMVTN